MLADDELDFDDDFGDLGELETGGLTTEELEKELGLDLELDLEPISEESLEKPKKDTSEKITTSKDNNKKQDEKPKQEEEKKATSKTEENKSTSKQVEPPKKPDVQSKQEEKKPYQQTPAKKYDSTKKPIPTSLDNQYNNNNFNNSNRNFNQMGYYPMQQQPMFYPQMQANFMAMNGMFPYQQQQQQQQQAFTNRNRIYVNPNFKGGNAQVMGQRPPMVVQKGTGEEQNNLLEQKARDELLNKQRMEAAESLRKKLASKKAEGGIKRKLPDAPINPSKRPTMESIQTKPANTGFSILGAAKARAAGPVTQQPQARVRSAVENNIRKLSTPATSRINRREEVSPMARPPPVQRPSPVARLAPAGPSVSIPNVPIVTNGKSNVVIITNLKPDVTYNQIKTIADTESGTNNISHNKEEGFATVAFPAVENAVTFRRKYNRTQMGESHINIAFKK